MNPSFYSKPVLNSPYEQPTRHWELDAAGQPTQRILPSRREVKFLTAIPKNKKQSGGDPQQHLTLGQEDSQDEQIYHASIINGVRNEVDRWRNLPNSNDWGVTPETARLLKHWRHHDFIGPRPFFCQIEAVETVIWLSEVAPKKGKLGQAHLKHLEEANEEANPGLMRLALKLATGAGKTTVMAMLIAWQTVNAIRHPKGNVFTRGFLIVTPGLTIRDRLRVLLPNDTDSYYRTRELVPPDMLGDLDRCKIVITNYHAFKRRERLDVSKGTRSLIKGRTGTGIDTLETEGQMIQRVMGELMGLKNIWVINDEAHHCYQVRPRPTEASQELKGDDKKEAEENNETARLWINGLYTVQRQLGIRRVVDLSATPFFLRGSGYRESTLFPWTMSDFSLMDAIECGIVKLPRVPVADNTPNAEAPVFRNLWEHIKDEIPKSGRSATGAIDPSRIPIKLQTALEVFYGHYEETFQLWREANVPVPPCFIIVCNNTATSKLVYDYISGYKLPGGHDPNTITVNQGALPLFSNYDRTTGQPLAVPRTLLIDSQQLESGEALDDNFRHVAQDEIAQFRREIIERTGNRQAADRITDADLLREVMNTVGKPGKLGESIRCVVSVSMLTEGWDANTVTHVLGVRAFGTQLLCEQVVGRALRRSSYELNEEGLFDVEYADVMGIPFDFTSKPTSASPAKPREAITVKAIKPERNASEIRFPRVQGYRIELPQDIPRAIFTDDATLELTPKLIGPTESEQEGIVGKGVTLTLSHTQNMRLASVVMHLTRHLVMNQFHKHGQAPNLHLFGQLKPIVQEWVENHVVYKGNTYHAQLTLSKMADLACERIKIAIERGGLAKGHQQIQVVLDPFNPVGTTAHVNFTTTKTLRWKASAAHCHLNWLIADNGWEIEFCRAAENHPAVHSYVKNHNLGFEVPYLIGSEPHRYRPDYILRINDGKGTDDLLNLIVEIKGFRNEHVKDKTNAIQTRWIPGVNALGSFGRWAFIEFTDVYTLSDNLGKEIERHFNALMQTQLASGLSGRRS